eukprot:3940404-Rhodomonas_salina.1
MRADCSRTQNKADFSEHETKSNRDTKKRKSIKKKEEKKRERRSAFSASRRKGAPSLARTAFANASCMTHRVAPYPSQSWYKAGAPDLIPNAVSPSTAHRIAP